MTTNEESGPEFTEGKTSNAKDYVSDVAKDVGDALDNAVDFVAEKIGSDEKTSKIAGGAAVGALAAVVLPVSLVGGAMLGAGYAALRNRKK